MGESDEEIDKMLLQLEQECLEVYRRKVDQSNRAWDRIDQGIADSESELSSIYSSLGFSPTMPKQFQMTRPENVLVFVVCIMNFYFFSLKF